jgi:hypothetical protein
MARNGSGTYSNPYPNFVSGTVISSAEVDANNSDVATALTQSIAVDGQTTVTANLPMNANKFTGLAVGAAATDSLSLGQAQAEAFIWCGTAGGTADAITLAPSPAITAYAAGQRFVWMASSSVNTGATTVAISGLGAIALQDNGAALVAGNHAASKMFMGILNTTSTVQIMQVQSSGTDPLIISSLTVNGASQLNGTLTAGVNDTGYDVKFFGATSGAYMLWDESADDLKLVGAAGLTVAGNIDVDGTTNLDAVDIDGAVQIDGIVQVGVDGTGYDVKLFGDASGSYALWDQSSDDLILAGAAGLSVAGGSVLTGVTTHGGNVVSDADSTDDLGTTSVRWANLFVDAITATDQITATGFTGTLDGILGSGTPAAATVTTIDASGVATATTFEPDGDTAAGDNAAMGYTSVLGAILTGQGSTNDVTLVNDADATVLGIPTGTTNVTIAGTLAVTGGITGVTSLNSGQIGGRRNILYNGAMNVAQRSTSVAGLGATSGYYTVDRWRMFMETAAASAGRFTMAQVADGPPGFANCMQLSCTTADTSIAAGEGLIFVQYLEGQDLQQIKKGTASAEQLTVSFWVKGNASATYVVELYDLDNNRQISKSFAVTTSWAKITLLIPADTTGAFGDDTGPSLHLAVWLHGGTTWTGGTLNSSAWAAVTQANRAAGISSFYDATSRTFFITGVQMEIGATASEFESRTYGEELALCQRYYYLSNPTNTSKNGGAWGSMYAATAGHLTGPFPVPMRTAPTVTFGGTNDTYYISNVDGGATGTPANTSSSALIVDFELGSLASSTIGQPIQYNGQLSATAEL